MKDGFYWYLAPPPKNQLYTENWTIVEVKNDEVWFIGSDMDHSLSNCPGTYVPVTPRVEDGNDLANRLREGVEILMNTPGGHGALIEDIREAVGRLEEPKG